MILLYQLHTSILLCIVDTATRIQTRPKYIVSRCSKAIWASPSFPPRPLGMAGAVSLCAVTSRTSSNPFQGEKCKYAGQSVRALPMRILSVGKKRSPGVQLMADEYVQKLKYYCSVEDVQIRSNPRNARDMRAQVDDEDKAVMNIVRSDDWVVMLDERGQDIGSEQMAGLVADAGHRVKLTSHYDIFVNDLYHTCKFLKHEMFSNERAHCHFAERASRVYHATDPGPPLILG